MTQFLFLCCFPTSDRNTLASKKKNSSKILFYLISFPSFIRFCQFVRKTRGEKTKQNLITALEIQNVNMITCVMHSLYMHHGNVKIYDFLIAY